MLLAAQNAASCGADVVVLLLWFRCCIATTHHRAANDNKQHCCWFSMSMGSSGGHWGYNLPPSWCPPLVWRCLLAVATVCCLGSLLCCLTIWYQGGIIYLGIRSMYFGLELCSAIVCHFSAAWSIMFAINRLFVFVALPRRPYLIPHDGFAIHLLE